MASKWHGTEPTKCQLCWQPFKQWFYDCLIPSTGQWGMICTQCFKDYNCKTGLGKGQKFSLTTLGEVGGLIHQLISRFKRNVKKGGHMAKSVPERIEEIPQKHLYQCECGLWVETGNLHEQQPKVGERVIHDRYASHYRVTKVGKVGRR